MADTGIEAHRTRVVIYNSDSRGENRVAEYCCCVELEDKPVSRVLALQVLETPHARREQEDVIIQAPEVVGWTLRLEQTRGPATTEGLLVAESHLVATNIDPD